MVFNLEKGFLFTIKEMFLRPGTALENYLEGSKRYLYYNPFRFSFITVTLSILLYITLGLFETSIDLLALDDEQNAQAKESIIFMQKYGNFVSLTLVPFVGLGTWLFFRKRNFAEHLVANFFSFGLVSFIGILFVPLYYFSTSVLRYQQVISLVVLFFYTTYFFKDYFKQNLILTFLKVIGSFVVGLVAYILILSPINLLIRYLQIL